MNAPINFQKVVIKSSLSCVVIDVKFSNFRNISAGGQENFGGAYFRKNCAWIRLLDNDEHNGKREL